VGEGNKKRRQKPIGGTPLEGMRDNNENTGTEQNKKTKEGRWKLPLTLNNLNTTVERVVEDLKESTLSFRGRGGRSLSTSGGNVGGPKCNHSFVPRIS